MFDHVTIRVGDHAASQRFYDAVLGVLGLHRGPDDAFAEWGDFSIAEATDEDPVTRRLHIAFAASSHEQVDAFWAAGVEAGFRDDGAPGRRPQYGADYYGGFLRDPDGNSAEAVHHDRVRAPGTIDHLWIRVADLAAGRAFYDTVAPYTGFRVADDTPERVQFASGAASFSLVAGTPTEHVHVAFPGDEDAVRGFHAAATAAGYRDNGPPGERPEYHAGYYAAFVLDPAGHNVEVVDHRRS